MLFTATEQAAQGQFDGFVDMLDMLMLVMLLGCGAYALYTAIRLRRSYMLFPNKFLYPGDCAPEDCLDEGGFIDYMLPRLTALGISMLVMGIAYAVALYLLDGASNTIVDIASIFLPCGAFVWYIILQRKAAKLFW